MAEEPVMSVRHGVTYSVYLVIQGLLYLVLGVAFHKLNPLVSWVFAVGGIIDFALAVLVRNRAYFEVFNDRIEILSPVFPRFRRIKPLRSIKARGFDRWISKREDFERFIGWLDDLSTKS